MAETSARMTVSVPKEKPERSEQYRRLVAAFPCAHCGKVGPSQAAHSDADGKAMQMKADDRTCYALCADTPGRRGCHSILGASGLLGKDMRRLLESKYAAQTRAAILAAGDWPKSLPLWPDETAPMAQTQE
jgi:hypothetical protein